MKNLQMRIDFHKEYATQQLNRRPGGSLYFSGMIDAFEIIEKEIETTEKENVKPEV